MLVAHNGKQSIRHGFLTSGPQTPKGFVNNMVNGYAGVWCT